MSQNKLHKYSLEEMISIFTNLLLNFCFISHFFDSLSSPLQSISDFYGGKKFILAFWMSNMVLFSIVKDIWEK